MKRKGKIILTLWTCLTFGVASLSALTECGQQTSNEDIKIIVTGGKNGIVGETIQLQATIIGGGSVTWTSNDVSVATVDENGNTIPLESNALIYNIADYAFAGAKKLKKLYLNTMKMILNYGKILLLQKKKKL